MLHSTVFDLHVGHCRLLKKNQGNLGCVSLKLCLFALYLQYLEMLLSENLFSTLLTCQCDVFIC